MHRHILVALLLACAATGEDNRGPCAESFLCDEGFCQSPCGPKCQVVDVDQCDGVLLRLNENRKDFCDCCGFRCVEYLKEGDVCSQINLEEFPRRMCGPGLVCERPRDEDVTTCHPAETPCLKALADYQQRLLDGQLGMNESPPACSDDNDYSPVQCSQGGLCRCADAETGRVLFGAAGSLAESRAAGQDCACARNYHDALRQGCLMTLDYVHGKSSLGRDRDKEYKEAVEDCVEKAESSSSIDNVFFPGHMRCLPNGNYDPIQCVDRLLGDDLCFCVDQTFHVDGQTQFRSHVTELECFDQKMHSPDYYRPCERAAVERRRRIKEYKDAGLGYYDGGAAPKCSPDGYYDKIQPRPGDAAHYYCSDRDGGQLESFGGAVADALKGEDAGANCDCAFARSILSEAVPRPTCCKNGNYRRLQCQAGMCFCVDDYGRQEGKEVEQLDIAQLECSGPQYACPE